MQESKPLFRPFFILEVEVKTVDSGNRYYLLCTTALLFTAKARFNHNKHKHLLGMYQSFIKSEFDFLISNIRRFL